MREKKRMDNRIDASKGESSGGGSGSSRGESEAAGEMVRRAVGVQAFVFAFAFAFVGVLVTAPHSPLAAQTPPPHAESPCSIFCAHAGLTPSQCGEAVHDYHSAFNTCTNWFPDPSTPNHDDTVNGIGFCHIDWRDGSKARIECQHDGTANGIGTCSVYGFLNCGSGPRAYNIACARRGGAPEATAMRIVDDGRHYSYAQCRGVDAGFSQRAVCADDGSVRVATW